MGVSTSIPKMGKGSESGGTTRNSAMVPEFTDFLPRDERIACYGIDCADILEWRMWTPGGEYTLNLNMKNVSTKPLKLKYKLPATKYFSMANTNAGWKRPARRLAAHMRKSCTATR